MSLIGYVFVPILAGVGGLSVRFKVRMMPIMWSQMCQRLGACYTIIAGLHFNFCRHVDKMWAHMHTLNSNDQSLFLFFIQPYGSNGIGCFFLSPSHWTLMRSLFTTNQLGLPFSKILFIKFHKTIIIAYLYHCKYLFTFSVSIFPVSVIKIILTQIT